MLVYLTSNYNHHQNIFKSSARRPFKGFTALRALPGLGVRALLLRPAPGQRGWPPFAALLRAVRGSQRPQCAHKPCGARPLRFASLLSRRPGPALRADGPRIGAARLAVLGRPVYWIYQHGAARLWSGDNNTRRPGQTTVASLPSLADGL